MSHDRVWKSLAKLEECGVIKRFKKGRSVQYVIWLKCPPDGLIKKVPLVRQTDTTSPPDGHVSVRQTDTKNTKEKEQQKERLFFSKIGEVIDAELSQISREQKPKDWLAGEEDPTPVCDPLDHARCHDASVR